MIGPIARALGRRQAAVLFLVLEVGFGFAVSVQAMVYGQWFAERQSSPTGMDPDVFVVRIDRPNPIAAAQRAVDRHTLLAVPGVAAVAPAQYIPMTRTLRSSVIEARGETGSRWSLGWVFDGQPETTVTLGLRFLEGRELQAGDTDAVVVSQKLAEVLFDDRALGKTIWIRGRSHPFIVVGVTAPVRGSSSFSADSDRILFVPEALPLGRRATYLVRAETGLLDAVRPAVRAAIARLAPDAVVRIASLDELRERNDRSGRGGTIIFNMMVVLATLVTLLGALAMSSFLVAERTKQIGTRRALGATKRDIVRYLLLENWLVTTLGLLLGLPLTYTLHRLVQLQVPDMAMGGKWIVLGMVLFWATGLLAALVPALRATEVSPSVASRTI